MIKIGITPCFFYPDMSRSTFGPKSLTYVENNMMEYVAQEGVLPIVIPDIDKKLLNKVLDKLDGVILHGGSDVAPETYGEQPIGPWLGDAYRDQFELYVIDYMIKKGKSIFGICRGFQLLNIYYGGSLYQDTITQREGVKEHRSAEKYDTIYHPINILENNFLKEIYPSEKQQFVNTVHHQSIKKLGDGLQIWATSDDGIIEAFGDPNKPKGKVMGVQWHPEFSKTLGDKIINPQPLYKAFLTHIYD
ncbi:gamma-glutamyl-gamma-aminobutyrate hydrolase family protein [Flammeovirga sp. SubArs3]|uniref:gamma-glutamyl-gamma-aminobutyrate hydrolase family protein n=1 Tax=Flammeovirga sp. SubArs3 TaxID=2995316 RepID=UPI00248B3BA6|nr:gamma-glutamyl-gamma-aminobutyrate hydrolase family protein [Flammeovirga sp. SubArs3]